MAARISPSRALPLTVDIPLVGNIDDAALWCFPNSNGMGFIPLLDGELFTVSFFMTGEIVAILDSLNLGT